jgi:hypothetical protein
MMELMLNKHSLLIFDSCVFLCVANTCKSIKLAMLPSQDLLTQEIFHQHQVGGRYWAFISAMANTSGGINWEFCGQNLALEICFWEERWRIGGHKANNEYLVVYFRSTSTQ